MSKFQSFNLWNKSATKHAEVYFINGYIRVKFVDPSLSDGETVPYLLELSHAEKLASYKCPHALFRYAIKNAVEPQHLSPEGYAISSLLSVDPIDMTCGDLKLRVRPVIGNEGRIAVILDTPNDTYSVHIPARSYYKFYDCSLHLAWSTALADADIYQTAIQDLTHTLKITYDADFRSNLEQDEQPPCPALPEQGGASFTVKHLCTDCDNLSVAKGYCRDCYLDVIGDDDLPFDIDYCACGNIANSIYTGSLGVPRCKDCHSKLLDEVRMAESLSNLGIFE